MSETGVRAKRPASFSVVPRQEEPVGLSDEELVRDFLAHDPAATQRIRLLVTGIVGFHGFFIPAFDRQDVVQEVLLQIWHAVQQPGFDRRSRFEPFARTIAYRRCLDWRRARRPTAALDASLPSGGPGPEASLLARERILLGTRVLGMLKDRCRDLIRLHTAQRLTYAQISLQMSRSEGALRVQMVECLGEARRILDRLVSRP